jgi:hypothetical protein
MALQGRPENGVVLIATKLVRLFANMINLWKEPVRGPESGQKLWRVLRVAFVIPLLGRFFVRDFSPLRPVMVQGKWEGVASRLGPVGFAGPP